MEVAAPTEELRREVLALANQILPELEQHYGVETGRLSIVLDFSVDTERGGETGSKGITLYKRSMEWLPGVLSHEIVHWLLRWHESYWNALPLVVEEGAAQLAAHEYTHTDVPLEEANLRELAEQLELTNAEYHSLPAAEVRAATYTGAYVAQQLGVDGLRALCQRAVQGGHKTIPTDWIVDAVLRAPAPAGHVSSRGSPGS